MTECEGACNYTGNGHRGEVKRVKIDSDKPGLATADLPTEVNYCRTARVKDKKAGFDLEVVE